MQPSQHSTQLVLDESQRLLRQNARDAVAQSEPLRRLRTLRDSKDPLGYSPEVWRRLADLGLMALPFDEHDGGLGLGLAEVVLVTEALGQGLAPEPYLGCIMLGGQSLALSKACPHREQVIPQVIAGTERVALAYHEQGERFSLMPASTRAVRTAHGYALRGEKSQVLGGVGADWFVVSAIIENGRGAEVGLFVVPKGESGLKVTPQWRLDSRNASVVTLLDVQVPERQLLTPLASGLALLEQVVDRATVALCGEMLGGMQRTLNMTLDYLRSRKQFGVPIGSFQALRHRAARIFIEQELARSAVMTAARALDAGSAEASAWVSVAKARCSDAYLLTTNEAIQLHGGIGMTDEHDIGLFLKHARTCEMTFGDAAFHRRRYARLSGF